MAVNSTYDIIIVCISVRCMSETERNDCYGCERAHQPPLCRSSSIRRSPFFLVLILCARCHKMSASLQALFSSAPQFLSFSYELLFHEKSQNRFSFGLMDVLIRRHPYTHHFIQSSLLCRPSIILLTNTIIQMLSILCVHLPTLW